MRCAQPGKATRAHARAAFLGVCLVVSPIFVSQPATAAESAYRYWSFWLPSNGAWQYAQQGPATIAVADGDVLGWRFGVSRQSDASAPEPRFDASSVWEIGCSDVAPAAGTARVAVAVDFGVPEHSPSGELPPANVLACATVGVGASGAEALSEVVDLRVDSGLICAFDGYPATECAPTVTLDEIANTPDTALSPDHGSTTVAGDQDLSSVEAPTSSSSIVHLAIIGIVIFATLASIALVLTRKSRVR